VSAYAAPAAGVVVTASGAPLAGHYDTVLAHEHLAIDLRCWLDTEYEPTRQLRDLKVVPENVPTIRAHPFACADNVALDGSAAAAGLGELAGCGRTLVVEVTPVNVGRDLELCARLDRELGHTDIVYGCGRYVAVSRPQDEALTVEDYREELLAELLAPHGPRPAVIGEIGTSDPLAECERRALVAAAQVQRQTGRPLYIHLDPWGGNQHAVLDVALAAGADPRRIVLCHLDVAAIEGTGLHRELIERGATIAFDIWGDEDRYGPVRMPTDRERIAAVCELIAAGYGDRIVHSQDVCTKTQLHAHGGPGYAHLSRRVRPALAAAGLDERELHRQLAGNALALIRPPAA